MNCIMLLVTALVLCAMMSCDAWPQGRTRNGKQRPLPIPARFPGIHPSERQGPPSNPSGFPGTRLSERQGSPPNTARFPGAHRSDQQGPPHKQARLSGRSHSESHGPHRRGPHFEPCSGDQDTCRLSEIFECRNITDGNRYGSRQESLPETMDRQNNQTGFVCVPVSNITFHLS